MALLTKFREIVTAPTGVRRYEFTSEEFARDRDAWSEWTSANWVIAYVSNADGCNVISGG